MNTQYTFMVKESRKDIPILPPDQVLALTLELPCLEHTVMVPKVFEPLEIYYT